MTSKSNKASLSWSDVKARIADVDRAGLLTLVHDLYAASKDNQVFVHARFGLGDDVLGPYKASIDRWLWPDVYRNQDTSVAKAKKAITDYKRAGARPDGLAELMVFYCERGSGFSSGIGLQNEDYFGALVRMFEQALKAIADLPGSQRPALWSWLEAVRRISQKAGYGVGEDMDRLLAECVRDV
jgi:hypothetical protein